MGFFSPERRVFFCSVIRPIGPTFLSEYANGHLKIIIANIFENLPHAKCFVFSLKHSLPPNDEGILISSVLLRRPKEGRTLSRSDIINGGPRV